MRSEAQTALPPRRPPSIVRRRGQGNYSIDKN